MIPPTKFRLPVAVLTVSAAAFGGLVMQEGFTDKAVIPIKGDRPTVGFGSTFDESGKPVKIGDTITASQAVMRSLIHIAKDESALKACVTAPISQIEYDTLVDFAYQYGTNTTCKSSMVRYINAGDYANSCRAYNRYKFAAGRDCSIRANNCYGVYLRSQERVNKCMEAQ